MERWCVCARVCVNPSGVFCAARSRSLTPSFESTGLMLGSHLRSDQLDSPNSPTKLDQTQSSSTNCMLDRGCRPLLDHARPYTTIHNSSTTSTRQSPRSLYDRSDLYAISTRLTRPLLDRYPMTYRSLLERLTTGSLLDFFGQVQNIV